MVGVGVTTRRVSVPSGVAMEIRPLHGLPKERRFVRLSGWAPGIHMSTHNHNLTNVVRGLVERVFRVEGPNGLEAPPRPSPGVFRRLSGFRTRLLKIIHCRPWSYDEFISSYRGAKAIKVEGAVGSLLVRGVQRADAKLKTFVKAEKLNLSAKPDPAPRVIQPRDPRYNAYVGRYLKALEHPLYAAIARVWGGPTVMKGYNSETVAEHIAAAWGQFNQPVGIGFDASRFDQHVSIEALQWEHSIYNGVFGSEDLRRVLTWQLTNRGTAWCPDGKVSYTVEGCRMSGDMNTAMGNCLLMCAMMWAYCLESGVRARLINNGDDCVLIVERQDAPRLLEPRSWFLQFGFSMKVEEPARCLEEIEFCQTRPVWRGDRWVMCRSPRVGIMKDLTNLRPQFLGDGSLDQGAFARWCLAVGEAGLALASGMPVFQAHYLRMIEYGRPFALRKVAGFGTMETGFEYMSRGMALTKRDITAETRASFYRAWGVLPDLQEALEIEIQRTELSRGILDQYLNH